MAGLTRERVEFPEDMRERVEKTIRRLEGIADEPSEKLLVLARWALDRDAEATAWKEAGAMACGKAAEACERAEAAEAKLAEAQDSLVRHEQELARVVESERAAFIRLAEAEARLAEARAEAEILAGGDIHGTILDPTYARGRVDGARAVLRKLNPNTKGPSCTEIQTTDSSSES